MGIDHIQDALGNVLQEFGFFFHLFLDQAVGQLVIDGVSQIVRGGRRFHIGFDVEVDQEFVPHDLLLPVMAVEGIKLHVFDLDESHVL